MVKCSDCKYLEEKIETLPVPINRDEIGPGPIPLPRPLPEPRPGPGPIFPYSTMAVPVSWFTCHKINEMISGRYGFREGYRIVKPHENRVCPDFKKI